jgi:KDO2-lipid IV(A) lauroyltransferase
MNLWRKLRQVAETALIGLGLVTVPCLPRRAILWLARGLGAAGYRLARRDRRVALANVAAALGDSLDARQQKEVVREAFRNFALVVLDLFWFRAFTRRRIDRWVRFDPSFDLWLQTRPCIMVTGHFGNWEVLGLASARRGAPPVSVAANFANPAVRSILGSSREATGQKIAIREGAIRALLKALRQGDRVGLVTDQNTMPSAGGMFVRFFGLPVPVSRAPAVLWKRTGAPILQGLCVADGRGGYALSMTMLAGPAEQSLSEEDVTRRIVSALERVIRAQPGQWLWSYKRWKVVPAGEDRGRYPFYARAGDSGRTSSADIARQGETEGSDSAAGSATGRESNHANH